MPILQYSFLSIDKNGLRAAPTPPPQAILIPKRALRTRIHIRAYTPSRPIPAPQDIPIPNAIQGPEPGRLRRQYREDECACSQLYYQEDERRHAALHDRRRVNPPAPARAIAPPRGEARFHSVAVACLLCCASRCRPAVSCHDSRHDKLGAARCRRATTKTGALGSRGGSVWGFADSAGRAAAPIDFVRKGRSHSELHPRI